MSPGNVLHDLIKCRKFECYHLNTVYRQKGDNTIIDNAYKILRGEMDFEKNEKFEIKMAETEKEAMEWVVDTLNEWYAKKDLDKIQVLSPIKGGECGTSGLNAAIMTGSRLIGSRLAYRFGTDPSRGDIIVFRFPDDESVYFVKRIIGLPGDIVEIIPDEGLAVGHVSINGQELSEGYVKEPMTVSDYMRFEVPSRSYFCMGDNRNNSRDSRYWKNHFVEKKKIVSKVLFQYWKGFKRIRSVRESRPAKAGDGQENRMTAEIQYKMLK